jgi:hypothetical protein
MYESKTKAALIRHIRKCEENTEYDPEDDLEEMFIDDEYTVSDHIENEETAIAVMKDFASSNELSTKSDEPFEEVIEYIVQKLYEKKMNTTTTYNREYSIYKFFFGNSEDVKKIFRKRIDKMLR